MLKRTANKTRKKEKKETMFFKVLMRDVVNVNIRIQLDCRISNSVV